jgi:hypothetical protein
MGLSGLSQALKPPNFTFFRMSCGQRIAARFQFRMNSEVRNQKSRFHSDPNITASICLWMFANLMRIGVTAPGAEVSGFGKSLLSQSAQH